MDKGNRAGSLMEVLQKEERQKAASRKATIDTAGALQEIRDAMKAESKKRDNAEKRTSWQNIAIMVLMVLTLAAAIAGILVR